MCILTNLYFPSSGIQEAAYTHGSLPPNLSLSSLTLDFINSINLYLIKSPLSDVIPRVDTRVRKDLFFDISQSLCLHQFITVLSVRHKQAGNPCLPFLLTSPLRTLHSDHLFLFFPPRLSSPTFPFSPHMSCFEMGTIFFPFLFSHTFFGCTQPLHIPILVESPI